MKTFFVAVILAALGCIGNSLPASAQAYIYVQTAPPAPIYETVPAAPGPGYVWVGGYYRWNGNRYVWVHGHYARHAGRWCGGHWRHGAHGYYWVNGAWC
ncbi:MAG TPA: YXWGXW repeat-containing protein [Candidatus Cybelea sp.]|nr:YXWGXW repeat-containing protein [Candidatus Cybelea sp.]